MKGTLEAVLALMWRSLGCRAHLDGGNATAQACKPSLKLLAIVVCLCLAESCPQLGNALLHYGPCHIARDERGRILSGFRMVYVAELIRRRMLQ